jgi:hypothetical protein
LAGWGWRESARFQSIVLAFRLHLHHRKASEIRHGSRKIATAAHQQVTTMQKKIVRIENWSVVSSVIYDGYCELEPGRRLTGDVLGHTQLRNGLIYTSAIMSIDRRGGLVETRNTIYELGEVSPDYKRWTEAREKAQAA